MAYEWFLIGLTIIVSILVAKLILKKFNAVFVFFASGAVILMSASLLTGTPILDKGSSLGNVFLDTFGFITKSFKTNVGGIGAIIMVVTGYAAYMKHIGASTKLAFLASRMLGGIKNKYMILSAFFLVGMALKLVLTSQASLAVLMLATVFPVLIALGIRSITTASVLALLCLDYGPNDGSTLFMATVAEQNVVDIFLLYQSKVAACIIVVTALLIPFYYRYMDEKDARKEGIADIQTREGLQDPSVPMYYIFLPLVPLVIIFADYCIPSTKIDVITANIIGFAITFLIEFIRRPDRLDVPKDMAVILKAMGDIFGAVVAIIISASVFAQGIKILGGITIFTHMISGMESAALLVMFLLTGITYVFAIIMGSGAAPFFAFGPLTPAIAGKLGIPTLTLLLPMELATSIGRASSPVCGALIAIAGTAGITPMLLAKRTAPLLFVMLLVNMAASYFFTM